MEMVKQEKKLRTPYLHSQASWDNFWETRKGQISSKTQRAYSQNFGFIFDVIRNHLGEPMWWDMKSLEVGCGRGIISDYLKDYGFKSFGIDILDNRTNSSMNQRFVFGNAKALPYESETFDVVITYGLLEHFDSCNQFAIIMECMHALKWGGIAIHYVVPKKMTNYFEDKNVYRDKCKHLQCWYPGDWVYPIIGENWKTNKWLGKGFFITQRR